MYNHFVSTFIDAQTAAHRHYSAVAAVEKRIFGHTRTPAVQPQTVAQIQAELRYVYSTVADHILAKARAQFKAGSVRSAVDRATAFRLAGFDIERSLERGEVPDFDGLWVVLESSMRGNRAPAGQV